MKFDKNDIHTANMVIYGGMLFDSERLLIKYLDTCEAEYVTSNFLLTREDYETSLDLDHSDLVAMLDQRYNDPDDEEEAIDDMFYQYQSEIEELLDEYDIYVQIDSRHDYEDITYKLSGTYGNLKKFANEYSIYLDLNNLGDVLFDVEKEADIDITSGDEDLILHNFNKD